MWLKPNTESEIHINISWNKESITRNHYSYIIILCKHQEQKNLRFRKQETKKLDCKVILSTKKEVKLTNFLKTKKVRFLEASL